MMIRNLSVIGWCTVFLVPQSAYGCKPTWFSVLFFAVTAVTPTTRGQWGQRGHWSIQTVWIVEQKILVHFFAYWGNFGLIRIHSFSCCNFTYFSVKIIEESLGLLDHVFPTWICLRPVKTEAAFFRSTIRIASSVKGARALWYALLPRRIYY